MGKFYSDKQKHSQQEKKGGGGGGQEGKIYPSWFLFSFLFHMLA